LLWVATHQPHIPVEPGQEWLDRYKDADIQVDPNFLESPPPRSEFNQGLPGENYYRELRDEPDYTGLRSGPPRTKEQAIEFMRYYYAVISRLDHQIGALVETLKSTGQYENTVIIYIGDNGYHLGNHGLGNKITMHEESARVPMFMHWAGLPKTGVRTESLVSSLDIYPTLLDLADVDAPGHLMGESLVPLLRRPNRSLREYVASECVGVGGKLGEGHRMVCTGKWKYILTDTNEEVLYNLVDDPYEMQDMADDPANRHVLNTLRQYMREWMKSTGDKHGNAEAVTERK
jgi:arylsulfatase A-like enzyme